MKILKSTVRRGFTLFEVVIALAISGTMLTTIFFMADSTIKSTNNLVEVQSEDVSRDAFFKLLERHFKELPGNCRMDLVFSQGRGGRYLSDMTFQNAPTSFNWGNKPFSSEAMQISTRPEAEGGLGIVLSYYDQPILDSDESLAERGIDPVAEIFLLTNVRIFEWKVLDGRTSEWVWDWDQRNRRPAQVELVIQFADSDEVVRRVFWVPNKQNPATVMRSTGSAARNGRNGNSGGSGGGGSNDRGGQPRATPEGSPPAQTTR